MALTAPARAHLIAYHGGGLREHAALDESVLASLRDGAEVTWLDVVGVHDVAAVNQVGAAVGVHALTIEDILNVDSRLKIEDFPNYLFFSLRMARVVHERGEDGLPLRIVWEKISVLLGRSFVVTFQEGEGDVFEGLRERLRAATGRVRQRRADYLAYCLLDSVVDGYLVVVDELSELVEALEDELLVEPQPDHPLMIHKVRRHLLHLRRACSPLRDTMGVIDRTEPRLLDQRSKVFFRDVVDHVVQVLESVDLYLHVTTGLSQIYDSSLNARTNDTNMTLAIIGAIFMPLMLITGIYGMNFEVMPELAQPYGYPLTLAVMASVAMGLWIYFRHRSWV